MSFKAQYKICPAVVAVGKSNHHVAFLQKSLLLFIIEFGPVALKEKLVRAILLLRYRRTTDQRLLTLAHYDCFVHR